MDARRAKQLIYGTLYGLVLLGIIAGAYFSFFRVAPSCFDNVQNQNETGVDCGGSCPNACVPSDAKSISVREVRTFTSSEGHVTALGQIADTSSDFAARGFDYTFTLYDASSNIVQTVSGHSFIYAGEVKYLLAPNVSVANPVDRAVLAISNVDWVTASALGIVPQFGNSPSVAGNTVSSSTVTVDGQLIDRDFATFTDILIIAILKSTDGREIGASQTKIDRIAPNETANFSVSYPAIPGLDPSLTQLYAYTRRQ